MRSAVRVRDSPRRKNSVGKVLERERERERERDREVYSPHWTVIIV